LLTPSFPESFYQPVNTGNQKVDQPLKAGEFLPVGWGAGGTVPQSFGIDDKDTDVENGFLKLYITQDSVNLDFIKQGGLADDTRGAKQRKQSDRSAQFWGAIRIPFVLERKRSQDSDDDDATRGREVKQGDPMIW
jgi:hypothetical protein